MTTLEQSRMIFVVAECRDGDANTQMNREVATVNYLMSAFPGNAFLCRGTFLLVELMHPRPARQWSDVYLAIMDRCDALYCVDNYRDHPLAHWASDNDMPMFGDYLDLEWFLTQKVSK